ncbi:molybdopterin molybdotransferase MoeA [Paenibacillus pasadenensis]|uniref:molybdopterin molybdotransferase MoeA n=1 Tax=Paenibacillus pasadenensis TaxID=217090 RepID=UPI00203ED373|nr:gephyrin-like molybdotransferase Glp [Paenibacillus pasadenensis]MCM3748646.1 molybdopterin molybdotransferase MoeA [Paenibacillus pasadenensis]
MVNDSLMELEDAIRLLAEHTPEIGTEQVALEEACGRVLAEPLIARLQLPPFRRAAMDGYAVYSDDLAPLERGESVMLRRSGELRPGMGANGAGTSGFGTTLRIFTGAPVPPGYDRVVMQEAVVLLKDGRVNIQRLAGSQSHIAEAGEDVPAGKKLIGGGMRLRARHIALLASDGRDAAVVRQKPRVSVIPIGSELCEPGKPLGEAAIYDSNGFMLAARLRELGAEVRRYAPVADDPEQLAFAIREAAVNSDLVVTAGGVSVGDCDYAHEAARLAGGMPVIQKVRMRPGTPTSVYGLPGGKLLAALSGNPSACHAGMELLVRPLVLKLAGRIDWQPHWRSGRLGAAIRKPCPYPRYIRASLLEEAGSEPLLMPLPGDRSGNVAAFASTDALVRIPAGGRGADEGELIRWIGLSGD